jgi:gamma-glutamylcyclotransferase (GGCT)/AIG2-like uncharacterized protein YtfP
VHLFVYGTLKRGDFRHHLLVGQEFVGLARTLPRYLLFNVGKYPAMVHSGDGRTIEGELWNVDDACVQRLDREEGCETNLYQRERIELAPPHEAIVAAGYLYQRSVQGLPDCGVRW